jgi:ADP-heptose:LPS heptosyltransferase
MDVQHSLTVALAKLLFGRAENGRPAGRVLVLRSSRFGDFINAMPALYALRKALPGSRVVLLTLPSGNRASASDASDTGYLGLLEEGIVDSLQEFRRADVFDMEGLARLRRVVREASPDMTLIMPFSGESAGSMAKKLLFLRLIGVGKNVYGWRGVKGGPCGGALHQVFGPLGALAEAGIDCGTEDDVEFPVRSDPAASRRVELLWEKHGLTGRDVVAVFPGGTYGHKRWPLWNFRHLVRELIKRHGACVVLVGGAGERTLCGTLARPLREGLVNLAGELDYLCLAEVFRRCALFIGNDSGPAHLASAVKTPCITIFSSIHKPGVWEPWNSRARAVREPVPCGGCRSERTCPKGTMECINRISVGRVLGVAVRELESAGRGKRWTGCAR